MSRAQDIEARAAEWLVRRDAAGGEESHDFAAWLASDPRHRAAYLRLAAAWGRTARMKRLRPEGPAIDPDLLLSRPRRSFQFWTPFALAAGIAGLALAGSWWFTRSPGMETYRTDVGGLSRIVLADGSTVTLNTDTEIHVRLFPKRREINLVRGEAQFGVAHNANRPFEVSAGGRIVRAVGTAFDVRLSPDDAVQVLVTEGRVAVEVVPGRSLNGAASAATVLAGEGAVADARSITVRRVSTTEASRRLAWEVGELSFQGETLKEAVAEFNRYNHLKLEVADPAIAELVIGGNFNALDIESFVAAVERSFNVSAKTSGDGTILLEAAAGTSH
jgi:transmembrane sensor